MIVETLIFSSALKIHGSGFDYVQIINIWGMLICISMGIIPLFISATGKLRTIKILISWCCFILSTCFIYPFLPLSVIEIVQIISNIIRGIIFVVLIFTFIYLRINWTKIKNVA